MGGPEPATKGSRGRQSGTDQGVPLWWEAGADRTMVDMIYIALPAPGGIAVVDRARSRPISGTNRVPAGLAAGSPILKVDYKVVTPC